MQGHISCNQNVAEYGNVIQAHRGVIFKHSIIASSRKHGVVNIKSEKKQTQPLFSNKLSSTFITVKYTMAI